MYDKPCIKFHGSALGESSYTIFEFINNEKFFCVSLLAILPEMGHVQGVLLNNLF